MVERTPELSELTENVDLHQAVNLNQESWRRRNRFISLSSPIEVPKRLVKETIKKVSEKFGEYILPYYREKMPIVGASVLPEYTFMWEGGYYLPNIGKSRPSKILVEFGTDWLAKEVLGEDPFKENAYLHAFERKLLTGDTKSLEYKFLAGIFGLIHFQIEPRSEITKMFAELLIRGNNEIIQKLTILFKGNSALNYKDVLEELKGPVDYSEQLAVTEYRSKLGMAIAKPVFFAQASNTQLKDSSRKVRGLTFIPGVINLSGFKQSERNLIHEYIHSLGFGENTYNGIPINGYKIGLGVKLKKNG